ncbi:MAG: hypothetical protein ABI589_14235, partial [Burkholderiales bacterium]
MPYLPPFVAPTRFSDPDAALDQVRSIYDAGIAHLRGAMQRFVAGKPLFDPAGAAVPGWSRYRAFYPFVRIVTDTVARSDSRLSFGFVAGPG